MVPFSVLRITGTWAIFFGIVLNFSFYIALIFLFSHMDWRTKNSCIRSAK